MKYNEEFLKIDDFNDLNFIIVHSELIAKILSSSSDATSTEESDMPEFETTSPGAHGTEGKPRHRKSKDASADVPKEKDAATSAPEAQAPRYTPDQADAVKM